MAPSSQSLSFRAAPQQFLLLVRELNARAPATVATLTSAVVGWVVTRAYDDVSPFVGAYPANAKCSKFQGIDVFTLLYSTGYGIRSDPANSRTTSSDG